MMRFPGIERGGRLEDGAIALHHFDFVGHRRHDAIADFVEHVERVTDGVIEHLRPDDAGGACLDEIDVHREAAGIAAHRAAHHVVHVEHAPGFFGPDAAIAQREGGSLRDHEHAAQLRQPHDDVVGQRIGHAAALVGFARAVHEGHHGQRRAAPPGASGAKRRISVRLALTSSSVGPGCACCAAVSRARRQISRSGALSSPSASNSLLALARCASPSAMRCWRASEVSSSSWALRSNGESLSHSSIYGAGGSRAATNARGVRAARSGCRESGAARR